MRSILYDALYTSEYYQEYVNQFNFFKHVATSSIYIRYYKMDRKFSVYDENTNAVESKYFGSLKYNIFDYTPLLNTESMTNDSFVDDMRKGRQYQGETNLTIFTLCEPSLNDLIVFPYKPNNQEEIFRVKDINTTLAHNKQGMNLNVYRLGIDYANITKKDLSSLNITSKYIYLIPKNRYIEDCKFKRIMEIVDDLNKLLKSEYFNIKSELYSKLTDDTNFLLYDLLVNNREFFDCVPIPYGIKSKCFTIISGIFNEPYKILIDELFNLLNNDIISCP